MNLLHRVVEWRVVEVREAEADGPMLLATIVQEGRAAGGGRAELFIPRSIIWPADGISIRTQHRGSEVARAIPTREPNGEIKIATPATPEIHQAFASKRFMSIEFQCLAENRTRAGIREIGLAYVDACAMTSSPEYVQAVAEVRDASHQRVWL